MELRPPRIGLQTSFEHASRLVPDVVDLQGLRVPLLKQGLAIANGQKPTVCGDRQFRGASSARKRWIQATTNIDISVSGRCNLCGFAPSKGANRQRIVPVLPTAHRSVSVASDRQRIAPIGGGGRCCSRHLGVVCSRSSAACVRASVPVTPRETSQIAGKTARVPDHRPPVSLALPTGNVGRNRHESASKVSAPADIQGGDAVAEETPPD